MSLVNTSIQSCTYFEISFIFIINKQTVIISKMVDDPTRKKTQKGFSSDLDVIPVFI
jgi:hypothetical protein